MPEADWLADATPAFRLAMATSWLAPAPFQEQQEQAIRRDLAAAPDWAEYLALIDRHRTPALSWAALSRVPRNGIPEPVQQELRRRSDACRVEGMHRSLVLAGIVKAFNGAHIPAMPLKGPVLSFHLYGDVGMRQAADLDVQVPKEDVRRAIDCLESAGWRRDPSFRALSPRQWESILGNGHEVKLMHTRAGCTLELHWRSHWEQEESTAARWARSTAVQWQGLPIHTMSAGDLALFLCIHGAIHTWHRAKWLGDVARAHSLGLLDWNAALDEARKRGVVRVVLATQKLLSSVYALPVRAMIDSAQHPQERLAPALTQLPLRTLKIAEDPAGRSGLAALRDGIGVFRYERLVRPGKKWSRSISELLYCQEDYCLLPLSDRFFWMYRPLRPILWLLRRSRRSNRKPASRLALKAKRAAPETTT